MHLAVAKPADKGSLRNILYRAGDEDCAKRSHSLEATLAESFHRRGNTERHVQTVVVARIILRNGVVLVERRVLNSFHTVRECEAVDMTIIVFANAGKGPFADDTAVFGKHNRVNARIEAEIPWNFRLYALRQFQRFEACTAEHTLRPRLEVVVGLEEYSHTATYVFVGCVQRFGIQLPGISTVRVVK